MGFRTGAYATVWEVSQGKGNYLRARVSIERKKPDGTYEQEFGGYCLLIGTAKAKGEKLKTKDRIKLGEVDTTNRYDKEAQKEYYAHKIFDFEIVSSKNSQNAGNRDGSTWSGEHEDDNSLPF